MNHQPQFTLLTHTLRTESGATLVGDERGESHGGEISIEIDIIFYLKFHEFSWAWLIIACFFWKFLCLVSMNQNQMLNVWYIYLHLA